MDEHQIPLSTLRLKLDLAIADMERKRRTLSKAESKVAVLTELIEQLLVPETKRPAKQ